MKKMPLLKRLFNNMHNKFEEGQVVSCSDPFLRQYTHSMEPCIGVVEEVRKDKVVVNCGDMDSISEVKVTIGNPDLLNIIEDKIIAETHRKRIWR